MRHANLVKFAGIIKEISHQKENIQAKSDKSMTFHSIRLVKIV